MKRSNRLVIFIGVLLAILAFVGIVIVLNSNPTGSNGPGASPTTVNVLVAKEDIKIGDPVTPDKVKIQPVDPGAVLGTPFHDPSQVGGQPALVNVAAGSQVNQEVVGGGAEGIPLSAMLKPGEKAIAFQVDAATGLNFLVKAGDHIDIVIGQKITVLQPTADTVNKPANQQRFETVTGLDGARTVKTVLQDKRVLYVSQSRQTTTTAPTASATPAPNQQNAQNQQITNVIIVFAGTDQDAEVIKFAQNDVGEIGSLTVTIRNTTDTDTETTTGITIDKLVTQYGLPLPNIVQRQAATP